jgi:hypothetical protein
MPINKLISTPCPECHVTLTNTGRCFNLACRFAGMQVVPLSGAKAVDSRNAQEPVFEETDDKPIETLQIHSVARGVGHNLLRLQLNRKPTDREIELIHWLGNLLLTAYDQAKDSDNAS